MIYKQPIRTEILWNGDIDSSITFLGETEKAYLIVYSLLRKKGTSLVSTRVEFEKWIPKSVWDNEKNFKTYSHNGDGVEVTTFIPPYFLNK